MEIELNEWINDFTQAKFALRNLEVLLKAVTDGQIDIISRLRALFQAYVDFIGQDATPQHKDVVNEVVRLLERIEGEIHTHIAKFSGKVTAQIASARAQVTSISQNIGKVRSLKEPQHSEAVAQLHERMPEFLSIFGTFLSHLISELQQEQAEYYNYLEKAFAHVGEQEQTNAVVAHWMTQFEQIVTAVEALKCVNPQPQFTMSSRVKAPGSPSDHHASLLHTEKVDSVLLAPVKWIQSMVPKDLKDVKFSDPHKGLLGKLSPSKSHAKHRKELVRATFDFKGETDSDLAFKHGQIITIVDKGTEDDPNWWCGELDGKRGLFPRNYVEPYSDKAEEEVPPKKDTMDDEYVPHIPEQTKPKEETPPPPRPPRPHKVNTTTTSPSVDSAPAAKEADEPVGNDAEVPTKVENTNKEVDLDIPESTKEANDEQAEESTGLLNKSDRPLSTILSEEEPKIEGEVEIENDNHHTHKVDASTTPEEKPIVETGLGEKSESPESSTNDIDELL